MGYQKTDNFIKEKGFEFDKELNCENAKVLFKKPQWLSII